MPHAVLATTLVVAGITETFRNPPLMPKRAIRIADEGGRRRRRDLRLRHCGRVAVEQDRFGKSAEFTT